MSQTNVEQVLEVTGLGGVVAIVRLADLSQAVALSRALLAGGITALEFTLTNPAALEAITEVRKELPEFAAGKAVIGAGTVLNPAAAQASIDAGAQFIVAPSTNFGTIEVCKKQDIAILPGALTPTEIVNAWEAGASAIKVFPARAFGPNYFKDLREPLPQLKLLPTGGVSLENAGDYIRNGAIAIGVGGNLVDKQLINAGNWDMLAARGAMYVQAVHSARSSRNV